jgi:hypothetical protein
MDPDAGLSKKDKIICDIVGFVLAIGLVGVLTYNLYIHPICICSCGK